MSESLAGLTTVEAAIPRREVRGASVQGPAPHMRGPSGAHVFPNATCDLERLNFNENADDRCLPLLADGLRGDISHKRGIRLIELLDSGVERYRSLLPVGLPNVKISSIVLPRTKAMTTKQHEQA